VSRPAITAENVRELFPEVNTSVIGGSHSSATSDDALAVYDEEQIKLMDEVCIVLDENDLPIGSASKKVCELWRTDTGPSPCTPILLLDTTHTWQAI
jgi:isopentenyl-diphosphate delta-isomerase